MYPLDEVDYNIMKYKQYQSSKKSQVRSYGNDIVVYELGTMYVGLSHTRKRVVYRMTFELNNDTVCQLNVWSDINDVTAIPVQSDIFWHVLVEKYSVLVDSHLEWPGHKFWSNRLYDAIKNGHALYVTDLQSDVVEVTTFEQLHHIQEQYGIIPWGYEHNGYWLRIKRSEQW